MKKENTFDLQLFGRVSNPYTFTMDGNYTTNASIKVQLVDLSYYARDNISNYKTVTSIPQSNLNYLQSGLHASDMGHMFYECEKLTTIPKLNIDTSKCTSIWYMFLGCTSLTSLDVSNFDTSSCSLIYHTFYNCKSLKSLNASGFDFRKASNAQYMFAYCESLTTLNVSNWKNTSNITNMNGIFQNCSSLTTIDISSWDTSNVIYMSAIFQNCTSLTTINGVIDMKSSVDKRNHSDMFKNCSKLKGVKIKNPPAGFDGSGLSSSQYTIVS